MKKLLLILFAMLFILSGCETVPTEPSIYGTEPNKFPGKKYTTYYHVPSDVDFPKDEYDPLSNQIFEQNYMVQYANLRKPVHEITYKFTYRDIEYKGEYLCGFTEEPTPYIWITKLKTADNSKYYAAHIWLDSGNVKQVLIDELTVGDGDISKAGLIKKANSVASEFIDISDYEINVDMLTLIVTYNKKYGDLYLEEPFFINFNNTGALININLGHSQTFKGVDYDIKKVIDSVTAKVNDTCKDEYTVNKITPKFISICKYGVPTVLSEVTLKCNSTDEIIALDFYTKLCD